MTSILVRGTRLVARSLRRDGHRFLTLWPRVQRTVPGWLFPEDARLLYALAHHGPGTGAIVEIGSAWGLSTIFLASGTKAAKRERVTAIDPHTGDPWYLAPDGGVWPPADDLSRLITWHAPRPSCLRDRPDSGFSSLGDFRANLQRFNVESWVHVVAQTSTDAARSVDPGPIRLLYIDGLHTYAGVRDDIQAWVPRVIPGGVIVFDDYFSDMDGVGVRRAVDELLGSDHVSSRLRTSRGHTWTLKR